jgi:hypothetical protein
VDFIHCTHPRTIEYEYQYNQQVAISSSACVYTCMTFIFRIANKCRYGERQLLRRELYLHIWRVWYLILLCARSGHDGGTGAKRMERSRQDYVRGWVHILRTHTLYNVSLHLEGDGRRAIWYPLLREYS